MFQMSYEFDTEQRSKDSVAAEELSTGDVLAFRSQKLPTHHPSPVRKHPNRGAGATDAFRRRPVNTPVGLEVSGRKSNRGSPCQGVPKPKSAPAGTDGDGVNSLALRGFVSGLAEQGQSTRPTSRQSGGTRGQPTPRDTPNDSVHHLETANSSATDGGLPPLAAGSSCSSSVATY